MIEKSQIEKPEIVTDDHLEFLDDLRESGETNMYGAGPYLIDEFGMSRKEARETTLYWMATFSARHSQ